MQYFARPTTSPAQAALSFDSLVSQMVQESGGSSVQMFSRRHFFVPATDVTSALALICRVLSIDAPVYPEITAPITSVKLTLHENATLLYSGYRLSTEAHIETTFGDDETVSHITEIAVNNPINMPGVLTTLTMNGVRHQYSVQSVDTVVYLSEYVRVIAAFESGLGPVFYIKNTGSPDIQSSDWLSPILSKYNLALITDFHNEQLFAFFKDNWRHYNQRIGRQRFEVPVDPIPVMDDTEWNSLNITYGGLPPVAPESENVVSDDAAIEPPAAPEPTLNRKKK